MADSVSVKTLFDAGNGLTVLCTNISDGSGEAAAIKVDRSALANRFGEVPAKLRIVRADWSVQGFPYIALAFDHTIDQQALVLSGTGKMCFKDAPIKDEGAAGGTGDIVLTAPAGASTGSYTLRLVVDK